VARVFGFVSGASISEGIHIQLSPGVPLEQVEKDRVIVVEGGDKLYMGVIQDIGYSVPEKYMKIYRMLRDTPLREAYTEYLEEEVFSPVVTVVPLAECNESGEVSEFSSVPRLDSVVPWEQSSLARKFIPVADYDRLFPIGLLDLVTGEELVVAEDVYDLHQLSFGIFGKAGTGKTYLANLLILNAYVHGYLHPEEKLTLLIFDVQGEYSYYLLDDRHQPVCQGASARMKTVDGKKYVWIYCVDEDENQKVGGDGVLRIPLYDVSTEILAMILEPFAPTEASINNLETYRTKVLEAIEAINEERSSMGLKPLLIGKEHWALTLLYDDKASADRLAKHLLRNKLIRLPSRANHNDLANDMRTLMSRVEKLMEDDKAPGLIQSIKALRRRAANLIRLPISFLKRDADLYDTIVKQLVEDGDHVTIDLGGRYSREEAVYTVIAKLIGLKIMDRIDSLMVKQLGQGMFHKLVIYLEEAHRFLEGGESTVFGRLAREYRKYGVVVVPIDQKPSMLDRDVVSMLWAMFIFQLTDDRDIETVVTGLSNSKMFRGLISRLSRGKVVYHNNRSVFPLVMKTINVCRDRVGLPWRKDGLGIYEAMDEVVRRRGPGGGGRYVVGDV